MTLGSTSFGAKRRPRMRAFLQAAVAAATSGLFYFILKNNWMAALAAGAALLLISAGFLPRLQALIERAGQIAGAVIGIALGWLLLVPVYYLGFSMGRLLFFLANKDSLQRRPAPEQESYWIDRGQPAPPEQYQRQF